MMKMFRVRSLTVLITALMVLFASSCSEANGYYENIYEFGRWTSGPSLHEHFADFFLVGNIWNSSWQTPGGGMYSMDEDTRAFFLHNFNAITAEDYHKIDQITNAAGELINLERADAIVAFANENDIAMIGHTLVWHSQAHLQLTGRTGNTDFPLLTRREAIANMERHINLVAGRWAGRMFSWDVLNEAFVSSLQFGPWNHNPDWRAHLRDETRDIGPHQPAWYNAFANGAVGDECGSDFIYYAFKLARLADPTAILYYNDYNEEQPGKREAIAQMVEQINERWLNDGINNPAYGNPQHPDYGRLLIEAIGMQSHYHLDQWTTNLDNVPIAMDRFIATGARISITELDITVGTTFNQYNPASVILPPLSQEDQERQAAVFARLFGYYLERHEHINRVSFWGMADHRSWRRGGHPLLFDTNHQPKEAFWAILSVELPH